MSAAGPPWIDDAALFPARRDPPIFEAFPELRGQVPFRSLVHAPTPVVAHGPSDRIWLKRDDRVSPLYGGNKIRRFEFLFADAEAKGRRTLVTVGGTASTQVSATALFGKRLGFEVAAVLFDQPETPYAAVANRILAGSGAEVVRGGGYAGTALRAWQTYARREKPYFIAPGASSPLALLGYVDAMLELGAQVRAGEMPRPDRIVLPAGSGGTSAALALGASILGWPTIVTPVRITDLIALNDATIALHAWRTARLLASRSRTFAALKRPRLRVEIDHRFIGRGYGYPTPEAGEAEGDIARMIGVPGEATYSAKAAAALRKIAAEHPRETILFWITLSSVDPFSGSRAGT